MGDQSGRSLSTLADQAEARTIVPAAPGCEDRSGQGPVHGHGRDHHDHDHDHDDDGHDHEHPFEWPEAIRIVFVAVTAAPVWFRLWEPLEAISLIGVVGLLVGGWPILKEAFEKVLSAQTAGAPF